MKNEKLFNETIDKLVKAYFEERLEHGNCLACAVGNIVGNMHWKSRFFTCEIGCVHHREVVRRNYVYVQSKSPYNVTPIDSDYTIEELMDIEWAFETAPKEGDWEFNGLMAVVDVLEKIHECDTETTRTTKQRFVKQLA